ncbi:MAG: hypothetical protein KOO60_13240, partial [Gemmatimonadales bacterium]|nr:hypothetical protein [Gemmatimonadales bacterium]
GFIQWDKSECTSLDILDGDDERGDVELEMGTITSISKARDNSVEVVLKDGTVRYLDGSNDVSSSNRGIMIEVAELGRVTVPWNRFDNINFSEGRGSGPGRETYANSGPIQGTVELGDGRALSGRLVFDLDEAWHWDVFNGQTVAGLEYDIPFSCIARIEPSEDNYGGKISSRVALRSGLVLMLGENQDTGPKNAGMLVFETEDSDPEHLPWNRIRSIEFLP